MTQAPDFGLTEINSGKYFLKDLLITPGFTLTGTSRYLPRLKRGMIHTVLPEFLLFRLLF